MGNTNIPYSDPVHMFSRLRALFGRPEEPPEPKTIALSDLPAWLDEEERRIQFNLEKSFEAPKADFEVALDHLADLIEEFEEEPTHADDGILLHPKVKSVMKTARPQTVRSLRGALEKRPSGDPTAWYTISTDILKTVIATAKGPAKHLHVVYKEEIPLLRRIIKDMGGAVNSMTKALDEAAKERETIRKIRSIHDTIEEAIESIESAEERVHKNEALAASLLQELQSKEQEFASLQTAPLKTKITQAEAEVEAVIQKYAQVRAPAAAVLRRAEKLLKRHKAPTDILKPLHDLAESQVPDKESAAVIEPALQSIRSLLQSGELQLKNREEQQLFGDGTFIMELEKAIAAYQKAQDRLSQVQAEAEADPGYQAEQKLRNEIENLKKEHDQAVAEAASAREEIVRWKEEYARLGDELQEFLSSYADIEYHLK